MKRFWFILLVLGLSTVFSTAALAADLKFSGEFYAAGVYLDKTSLTKDIGPSTAFYYQRLRVRTDFVVSPGLTLVTRFDAMERAWGATRSAATSTTLAVDSAGTTAENENISFDWAYISYQSPIGTFDVGYMNDGATGTIFGNTYAPLPRIKYSKTFGHVTLTADITKSGDKDYTAANNTAGSYFTDADKDKYGLDGVYKWKQGLAGMKVTYYNYADNRPASNYKTKYFLFTPYTIADIGPVNIQAEVNYATGDYKNYDNGTPNVKLENLTAFLDATATFGAVYAGGTVAYVSGDDPNTANKLEGGTLNGGRDWSPNLIMWNYDRSMWLGVLTSTAAASGFGTSGMANAFLYQGRIGVKPTDKLDLMTSFTYAAADKKPANYVSDQYGYELDVTATYKLTNNLTYMLGAGYLWTGDYFKGTSAANAVQNDYLLINKLTLTF